MLKNGQQKFAIKCFGQVFLQVKQFDAAIAATVVQQEAYCPPRSIYEYFIPTTYQFLLC